MALLQAVTDGSVTGTGTVEITSYILGGVLITADGTNDATVVLRRNDASGKQIFKVVTKSPGMFAAPISCEGATTIYYSISGTGAAGQIYRWDE